ncbi:DUF362 domain-containing protein [bacterium]
MKYKISDDCVGCGTCIAMCAHEAIIVNGDKYKIVSNECVACGNCVTSCPVEAIAKE